MTLRECAEVLISLFPDSPKAAAAPLSLLSFSLCLSLSLLKPSHFCLFFPLHCFSLFSLSVLLSHPLFILFFLLLLPAQQAAVLLWGQCWLCVRCHVVSSASRTLRCSGRDGPSRSVEPKQWHWGEAPHTNIFAHTPTSSRLSLPKLQATPLTPLV